MLRDRHEQPASGPQDIEQLAEHATVIVYVLEHVEDSDRIILPRDWKMTRIRLHERNVRKAHTRGAKTLQVKIGSRDAEVGAPSLQTAEHETIAAADFQEAARLRQVLPERPLDQAAPRTKPEAVRLELCERFERP